MKCFNCGAEAPVGNKFCPRCGASMSVGASGGMTEPSQTNPGSVKSGYRNQGCQNPGNMNPGYPNPGNVPPGYPAYGNAAPGGGMATASMVLGIIADLALVIAMFVGYNSEERVMGAIVYTDESMAAVAYLLVMVAAICGITGFILAICALKKKTSGKGKAIAGLVCNSIIVVPVLISIIGIIGLFIAEP